MLRGLFSRALLYSSVRKMSGSSTQTAAAAAVTASLEQELSNSQSSSSSPRKPRKIIAVSQMTSTNNVEENLEIVEIFAQTAKTGGASLLCLPENCMFMGGEPGEASRLGVAQPLTGPLVQKLSVIAKRENIWLSVGGFPELLAGNDRAFNTHFVIDDEGLVRAAYRKLHLFNVSIPNGVTLQESKNVLAGSKLTPPVPSPVGNLGMLVCYDLRFAEASNALRSAGADVILYPAAFTVPTGEAHWETMIRARAIETQCYVVAAAQYGEHNAKRSSFGHAMIVDPWGKIVAQCEENGLAFAEVDDDLIARVRRNMPIWDHRREAEAYTFSS